VNRNKLVKRRVEYLRGENERMRDVNLIASQAEMEEKAFRNFAWHQFSSDGGRRGFGPEADVCVDEITC
jgi:hypothetical protein